MFFVPYVRPSIRVFERHNVNNNSLAARTTRNIQRRRVTGIQTTREGRPESEDTTLPPSPKTTGKVFFKRWHHCNLSLATRRDVYRTGLVPKPLQYVTVCVRKRLSYDGLVVTHHRWLSQTGKSWRPFYRTEIIPQTDRFCDPWHYRCGSISVLRNPQRRDKRQGER